MKTNPGNIQCTNENNEKNIRNQGLSFDIRKANAILTVVCIGEN